MNIPKIADAIGYIDNELITATLEAPPKKRHNPVMKWMTAAALKYGRLKTLLRTICCSPKT